VLLAHSRHSIGIGECPLSGVKRTLPKQAVLSAFDQKRTCSYQRRLRRFRLTGLRFLTRRYLNTKRRIAEDKLSVWLARLICLTSAGTVIFLYSAISNSPYQNSSSREILVLKPSIAMERFMTANFMLRFSVAGAPDQCRTFLRPMQGYEAFRC
jgi:hypothetical protein